MSMSKSMPYYVTGLQTWAWAAVEHLLDGDNHPDGTPVWALTPTVSTSRDHTGGWTVTVTITTTDDDPLPCFPSSWSVSAVPARNGVVTAFRSMLDQRHAGNHETFATWREMLADLFDAWQHAVDEQSATDNGDATIATFRRVLNEPATDPDTEDAAAVRSATNARSAIKWAERLMRNWQRALDTDRPHQSRRLSAPLTVIALAKAYGEWGVPEEPSLHTPGLAMDALADTEWDAARRQRAKQHARLVAALIAERQRRETAGRPNGRSTQVADLDRHRQQRNHPTTRNQDPT